MPSAEQLVTELYRYIAETKKSRASLKRLPPKLLALLHENIDVLQSVEDFLGQDLLTVAVRHDLDMLSGLLIELKPKTPWYLNIDERTGQTAIHIAAGMGNHVLFKKLLQLPGANDAVNHSDKAGLTPMDYVYSNGGDAQVIFEELLSPYIDSSLESKSDVNSNSKDFPSQGVIVVPGSSPLHTEVTASHFKLSQVTSWPRMNNMKIAKDFAKRVSELEKSGEDINGFNVLGITPLTLAVMSAPPLVSVLLSSPKVKIYPEGENQDPLVIAAFAFPYNVKSQKTKDEIEVLPDHSTFWALYHAMGASAKIVDWDDRLSSIAHYPHVQSLLNELRFQQLLDVFPKVIAPQYTARRLLADLDVQVDNGFDVLDDSETAALLGSPRTGRRDRFKREAKKLTV